MYLPSYPSNEEFDSTSISQTKILTGKYRGQVVRFSLSSEARVPDSVLALKYRGLSYLKSCYFS